VPESAYLNLLYFPLYDLDGTIGGVIAVVSEVTEEVLARREAETARHEAEEARASAETANRAKAEFLAAMSHELRTPLNAIAGYAQLLEMGIHGPVTESQRDALDRLQRSEQRLLSLVNDVLNFAKLEAGRVEYQLEAVALARVVADVVPMIEPQLAAKHIAHEARIAPELHALADGEKLEQILLNLLSNAAKFTGPGGRVTLAADAAGGAVRLHVADTGRGIPTEKLESIFDPFVQVDTKLTRTAEGTGLGLAISRDLARGMGGDLSVASVLGEGSTFTLTLPAA
jgi:signal transduction histidine kinase